MRWLVLALTMPILLDCLMFVNFNKWKAESEFEYQQRVQDIQVNYAIDAATYMLAFDGTSISTDYADEGQMYVEPNVALNAFLAVMLRSKGWSDTVENRKDFVEDYMPFFLVAGYDGYYLYASHDTEETFAQMGLVPETSPLASKVVGYHPKNWTPKIPYSEACKNSSGERMLYLYNIKSKKYTTYDVNSGVIERNNVLVTSGSGPGTTLRSKQVIANKLMDACNAALLSTLRSVPESTMYIPATYSEWSTNVPVDSVTCLTMLSNTSSFNYKTQTTFAVGGSEISDNDFCICYKGENGERLYTRAENRDDVEKVRHLTVIGIEDTPMDAATKGYYFDTRYL